MKVIMTGGGTGGHIYPAIAIADEIKDKHPDAEIMFVGTERGLEKTLVPQHGYPIRFITVTGFNRKKLLKNLKVFKDLNKGIKEAKAIVKEFQPDIVIGTGGYVCGPVVKSASNLGIRTFIHEQNAAPGLTNKILEKYVEKIFIGFGEARVNFKKHDKIVLSGNPVRKNFFHVDKKACRSKLGIDDNDFVVLSFGGSQGAVKINEVMTEVVVTLSGIDKLSIFFVTGNSHYEKIVNGLKQKNSNLSRNMRVLPYVNDMEQYLTACDLVISRSGALTVSEIIVCGKPSILIPSPNVTGNHQFFNAKALVDRGGAMMIEEKDLDPENLIRTILKMKNDSNALMKMAAASKNAMRSNAAEIIYNNLGINQ